MPTADAAYTLLPGLVAFFVAALGTQLLIPRLLRSRVVGRDVHKPGRPVVAEMGGIAIFAGIVAGICTSLGIATFLRPLFVRPDLVVAALATIGTVAVVGIADDIVTIRQRTKALIPAFGALPLVAVAAGNPLVFFPFLGAVDLKWFYPLLLVPLIVTVCSNASNMLAGWNGVEAGLGLVIFSTLAVWGAATTNRTLMAIALPAAAACLAFYGFNSYPARVFPGDVGALTIGSTFATAVIVANVEFLGAVLLIPFIMDFAMKARHGFPKTFAELEGTRLICPRGEPPKGLGQLVLAVTGGMSERALVLSLMGLEALFGAAGLALMFYIKG